MPTLTPFTPFTRLERLVFAALVQNAEDCSGGDFAIIEELDEKPLKITRQQLGGVLTALQNKAAIEIWDPIHTNEGTKWHTISTQVTFPERRGK